MRSFWPNVLTVVNKLTEKTHTLVLFFKEIVISQQIVAMSCPIWDAAWQDGRKFFGGGAARLVSNLYPSISVLDLLLTLVDRIFMQKSD